MFTAAVYSRKGLFVQQTHQTVLCRHLLHDFHRQLVMIRRDIGRRIDGGKLMLCRCDLIMLCFCQNPQLPELFIQLFHIGSYPRLDHAEIMIVHFLPPGRLCTEKSASRKAKIPSLIIHFLCDQEIFLLRSHRCADTFYVFIPKQVKNTHRLLV